MTEDNFEINNQALANLAAGSLSNLPLIQTGEKSPI